MLYLGCEGGGFVVLQAGPLLLDAQSHVECLSAVELSRMLPLTLRNGGHDKILQDIHRQGDVVHKACQLSDGKKIGQESFDMKAHRNERKAQRKATGNGEMP